VPIPGPQVRLHGVELTAESAQGRRNRIGTVLVRRVSDAPEESALEAADVRDS
jgi:hypothetical protein